MGRLARWLSNGRATRLVAPSDVTAVLTFSGLFLIVLVLPRRFWPAVARGIATVHTRLRRPSLDATVATLAGQGVTVAARDLGIDLLGYVYLENMEAMVTFAPFRGLGQTEMVGLEHVQAARALGRGVIIWKTQGSCSSIGAVRRYPEVGLPVMSLRSYAHPLSDTWLGMRYINQLRNRAEDRSIAGIIPLERNGGAEARREIEALLRRNGIISMAPIGTGKSQIAVPFLGGTLRVARGVPSLALKTGAAIVPMTAAVRPGPVYVAEFDPPIIIETDPAGGAVRVNGQPTADPHLAVVEAYARPLAEKLRKEPARWRGWLLRHTWVPQSPNPAEYRRP
jgi:lauroyl/myristoyl acyltransferase